MSHPLRTIGATALVLAFAFAPTASARPDRGDSAYPPRPVARQGCTLQRVGTEYTKCGDLTGNGATAPAWISEFGA